MLKMLASLVFALFLFVRPAVSLTCYQQIYTPGLSNTNNPLLGGGNPQLGGVNQQQQQLQYSSLNLPTITCSTTATNCFKFVCYGTSSYIIRGCLDYTQPQYSCQAMDAQCLGGTGQCYLCSGNNCNGALSMRSGSATLLLFFLGAPLVAYVSKKFLL